MPTNPHLLVITPDGLLQKEAAGEILARLARLGMTPIPGTPKLLLPKLNPQQLDSLESQVQQRIQTGFNDPIRRGLERVGLGRGISKVVEKATADVPGTPRLFMKHRTLEERQALGNRIGQGVVNSLSEHPETLATTLLPIPGAGPAWLGVKSLLRRGLGIQKAAHVEPYQQKEEWSCSAGCLKAVMEHWGRSLDEMACIDAIGTRAGRGAETTDIVRGAQKLGFEAFERGFDSLEDAKELLDVDVPIICDIQSFNHPGKGHYVVMTHFDGDNVHLMDPNTPGNLRVLSKSEMNSRWWDRAIDPPHQMMKKWGIVIHPKQLEPQSEAEVTSVGGEGSLGGSYSSHHGTSEYSGPGYGLPEAQSGINKYANSVEAVLNSFTPEVKHAIVKGALVGALFSGLPAVGEGLKNTSDIVVDDPMTGPRHLSLAERFNYALHEGIAEALQGGLGGAATGALFHALSGGKVFAR